MGASISASYFVDDLRKGKEIPWEEVTHLSNIVGGEIRLNDDCGCRGIISSISLENGVVSIMCPWILQTPMDEDGDPVGDYMHEEWEVMNNPKLPLNIYVPKSRFVENQEAMIHTASGSYASSSWAVRSSEYCITFWAGAAHILLTGYPYDKFDVSVHELALKFGLKTE